MPRLRRMHNAGPDRFLNVVDVEATCWSDAVPEGQTSEIPEIGLCVIDMVSHASPTRSNPDPSGPLTGQRIL